MTTVLRACSALTMFVLAIASAAAEEKYVKHSFAKAQLSDQFFGEGATFADVNRDGAADIISGPFLYFGPKFIERAEYYPAKPYDIEGYSDNFFAFSHDFNADGWPDILIVGFPGKEAFWYENPQGKAGHWPRHVALPVVDNESPTFTDITGDGRPDLVCMTGGQAGFAEIPSDDPTKPWKFIAISPPRGYQRFTHGMGVGDLNGDGRMDYLEKNGWYEHPATRADGQTWDFHEVKFADAGGAQMYVYDLDGDGDNDVITSKAAHAFGLSWFENVREGDAVAFREHKIMGSQPEENDFGVVFSQLHALDLIDMDRDGLLDIVTGKRWWAHSQHDPGSLDAAVNYWFKTVREGGKVGFVPHLIDSNSGVGTQIVAGDFNGDQWPDLVVGNKKGTFALTHRAEEVDKAAWEEAQPKRPQDTVKAKLSKPESPADPADGIPATAADGRALNFDFETGDLTDWTADGDAFGQQPMKGDTIHARRPDSVSGHKGDFWIGTYERAGDRLQGTLTSASFPVTHRYASFLIGGGAGNALGLEIVRSDDNQIVFKASGHSKEEMKQAVADLQPVMGKEVFLRLIDRGSAGWAHVNFDHFRFHDEKPPTAEPKKADELTADDYPYAGLPAAEAAKVMTLPEGFSVKVFAAEPDVKQPIAMAMDDRGRVWIAEAYEYPRRAAEGQGRDRILIFEDADGDGKFDKRTVFAEGLNLVSGIEVGFGGVWVGAAPYFMFIPDRDGNDVPDGEPEILLDGWAYQDTHETLNTFIWGPDGWLYGCHGVFTHSRVGKPGTPDGDRVPLNAAIWRYHPTRHEFEIFAEGTSNPWGVDFDDYGNAFCTACVIPHLYHVIPGARYQRQAGSHFNPYTYADIKTIADHLHYLGEHSHARNDSSGAAGGGHAHSGAMIYLGGAWPEEYRGRIFMNNIHGQRLNTDILKPRGSGFVGSHGPDFLLSGDLASQILNIRYGPDGQAYFIDWYDTNACHHNNVDGHDRTNGRAFKIVYSDAKAEPVDLKQKSDAELVEYTLHKNDWFVRHSRRLLQERAAAGRLDAATRGQLATIASGHADATRRLRAMWALHVTGGLPGDLADSLLADPNEHVRGWAIQLSVDGEPSRSLSFLKKWEGLAQSDASPVVRRYLASALQRLPADQRWTMLEELTRHAEDADDHNLPLMYWYAAEPLAERDPERALKLALACGKTIPLVRDFLVRRIASIGKPDALSTIVSGLASVNGVDEQLAVIKAMRQGLEGQRRATAPANWAATASKLMATSNEELLTQVVALGVTFGDQAAMDWLRARAESEETAVARRREALQSLLAAKDPQLVATLVRLLGDAALRDLVLPGLALYDDAAVPDAVLGVYKELPPPEKRTAVATLCARASNGLALLKAIEAGQIPAEDLSADLVRQLHLLNHREIDEMLRRLWGQVRSTPADKAAMIASFRALVAKPPAPPDLELGRAVFAKTCQQCHILYGAGGNVGPDLTGANRSDLEYLLSNIIDPAAVIAKDYQQTVIVNIDGLVIAGIAKAEDDKSVTIQTATETIVVPKDEIEDRQLSDVSMMPDDQLKQFAPAEIASLLAYLGGKSQTPLLARKDNQALLFNGRDLAGWTGDTQLWSVENGEIVGRSPGIQHNSFLISDLSAEDFRLTLEVKLAPNEGNSGVQFRSVAQEGGEVRGYQADMGAGWWGKLYEEQARALLWDKSGEQHVKKGEWNRYEIRAERSRIQTWINGQPCVDLDDPEGKRRGVFALQIHSGGPMEVRFRDLKLDVLD